MAGRELRLRPVGPVFGLGLLDVVEVGGIAQRQVDLRRVVATIGLHWGTRDLEVGGHLGDRVEREPRDRSPLRGSRLLDRVVPLGVWARRAWIPHWRGLGGNAGGSQDT